MKAFIVLLLAGVTYVAAAPAFAGRDQTQMMAIQAAIEKKAEDLAAAKQNQAALAGATGVQGKVGPGTQKPRAGRPDTSAHP